MSRGGIEGTNGHQLQSSKSASLQSWQWAPRNSYERRVWKQVPSASSKAAGWQGKMRRTGQRCTWCHGDAEETQGQACKQQTPPSARTEAWFRAEGHWSHPASRPVPAIVCPAGPGKWSSPGFKWWQDYKLLYSNTQWSCIHMST